MERAPHKGWSRFERAITIGSPQATEKISHRVQFYYTVRHMKGEMVGKKSIAESFLILASSGKVREAYDKYVHPDFRHHNAYFRGDRDSLLEAMEENVKQFPNKSYEALRVLEDGDLVAIHGKVVLSPDSQWSVIHMFRFQDDLIIEEWEASQEALRDSPNANGVF